MASASRRAWDGSVLLVLGIAGCVSEPSIELGGAAVGAPCGDGDADVDGDVDVDADVDADGDADGDPGDGEVRVRVVHASPDAPAVDVYAAGIRAPLIEGLQYTETSAFLTVPAGTYDFEVRAAGASPDDAPAYSTGDLALPGGATVTAIAAGLLGSQAADSRFRVLPIVEAFDDAPAGTALVRIVHASPDAPAVAIDVGDDGTAELVGLERFTDTGAAGVALPAGGALQVGIRAGNPLGRVTAFTTPALPAGAELLVIATGLLGKLPREQDGFGLLVVGPDGTIGLLRQNPTIYVLHACPDANGVDVQSGGATLASNLGFGDLSAPIQVPPGRYPLAVLNHDEGTVLAETQSLELVAGERALAIATGFLDPEGAEQPFRILALADGFVTDDGGNARLRAVHASPDAPAVDIGLAAGDRLVDPPLIEGVVFGDATDDDGLSVPAAVLSIGVAAAGSLDPVAIFGVAPAPGVRAFAIAAGALAPEPSEEGFRLLVVNTAASPWSVASVHPD